jgi:hypothetical protein
MCVVGLVHSSSHRVSGPSRVLRRCRNRPCFHRNEHSLRRFGRTCARTRLGLRTSRSANPPHTRQHPVAIQQCPARLVHAQRASSTLSESCPVSCKQSESRSSSVPNRTATPRVPNSCPILRATAVTHGYSWSAFPLQTRKPPSQSLAGFVFQAGHASSILVTRSAVFTASQLRNGGAASNRTLRLGAAPCPRRDQSHDYPVRLARPKLPRCANSSSRRGTPPRRWTRSPSGPGSLC